MTEAYFWPGTKIIKSFDNDFNWRNHESRFLRELRITSARVESGMKGGQVTREQYRTPEEKPYQLNAMLLFSRAKERRK